MTADAPLLSVQNLSVAFRQGGRESLAVDRISFDVNRGETVAIVGPSGAGKSTLFQLAERFYDPAAGSIKIGGEEVVGRATESVVRMGVAHVPDGRGTFTGLSVEENLKLGSFTRKDKAEVARDMERMYTRFPRLKERRMQQAGTLSGGEQQMLAISRALMLRPKLLLLDEPSFGLAPLIVAEIFRIMREINKQDQVTMLLVEQNASLALDLADEAYLLETGRVAISGPCETIKNDETVRRVYLGY